MKHIRQFGSRTKTGSPPLNKPAGVTGNRESYGSQIPDSLEIYISQSKQVRGQILCAAGLRAPFHSLPMSTVAIG